MDTTDRASLANFVVLLVVIAGALVTWFLLVQAPWYAHAGAVVGILLASYFLVERVLSVFVNRWAQRRPK